DAAGAGPMSAAAPTTSVPTASTPPNPAPAPSSPGGAAAPAGTAAPAGPMADAGGDRVVTADDVKFTAPADWKQDPKPRMMRLVTLLVAGDAGKSAEVIVTKLNGPAGGMLENVNRWRGQVGLPPVATFDEKAVPKVKVGGTDAMLFDLAGPEAAPTKRQVQVVAERPGATYYIKIIGEASLVGAQKAKFDKMLTTVSFGG
ncbi:MAG: hypothetical protein JWO31_3074, partial [Phycisphaerales bacterium]|nr:hypothetical protein [Phycisphaerales bacterium]